MNDLVLCAGDFSRLGEAMALVEQHYAEVARDKDIPLDIDVERYRKLADGGYMRIYEARLDGKIVGYATFIIDLNSHYRGSLQAVQDVLYVEPSARGRMIGPRLVSYCDDQLAREGVQVVLQHQKLAHPALGVVLQRCGYEHSENLWVKRLDVPRETGSRQEPQKTEALNG